MSICQNRVSAETEIVDTVKFGCFYHFGGSCLNARH